MPGLVPGIHVLTALKQEKTWMAGTKPGHDGKRIIFKRSAPPHHEAVKGNDFFKELNLG
jgi:hypothetical protein